MTDLKPEDRALIERVAGPLSLIEMKAGQAHFEWATVVRLLDAARAEGLRSTEEVGGVEPVAWMVTGDGCKFISYTAPTHEPVPGTIVTPLFAAPPSREA